MAPGGVLRRVATVGGHVVPRSAGLGGHEISHSWGVRPVRVVQVHSFQQVYEGPGAALTVAMKTWTTPDLIGLFLHWNTVGRKCRTPRRWDRPQDDSQVPGPAVVAGLTPGDGESSTVLVMIRASLVMGSSKRVTQCGGQQARVAESLTERPALGKQCRTTGPSPTAVLPARICAPPCAPRHITGPTVAPVQEPNGVGAFPRTRDTKLQEVEVLNPSP